MIKQNPIGFFTVSNLIENHNQQHHLNGISFDIFFSYVSIYCAIICVRLHEKRKVPHSFG